MGIFCLFGNHVQTKELVGVPISVDWLFVATPTAASASVFNPTAKVIEWKRQWNRKRVNLTIQYHII